MSQGSIHIVQSSYARLSIYRLHRYYEIKTRLFKVAKRLERDGYRLVDRIARFT